MAQWHRNIQDIITIIDDCIRAQQDEALARQIEEQHRERVSPFAFSKCGISEGAELEFCCRGNEHTGERCTVADDKHVRFQDEIWSLTALAKHLLGTRNSVAGLSISNTTARG